MGQMDNQAVNLKNLSSSVGPHGTSYLLSKNQQEYKLRRFIWIVILSAGVIGTIGRDRNYLINNLQITIIYSVSIPQQLLYFMIWSTI